MKEESKLKRELLFLFLLPSLSLSFEKLDVNHLTKTSSCCCQSNKNKKVSFSKVGRNVSVFTVLAQLLLHANEIFRAEIDFM